MVKENELNEKELSP